MPSRPRAAVFDLDGLLIDSEPLWERAEIGVFADVGVTLTLEDTHTTTGLRMDEVVAHWRRLRPWTGASDEEVLERTLARVVELIRSEGEPLPGAARAVELAAGAGLRLAVASSSPSNVIAAALERLGFADAFEAICSAEHLTHGKPHPQVFLDAALALGVAPPLCIALEDSLNGVIAAKAARMRVVAVPAPHHAPDPRYALADVVLRSLEELDAASLT